MTDSRRRHLALAILALAAVTGCATRSGADPSSHPFAWPSDQFERPPTVGGHSQGAPVVYAAAPSPQWTALLAAPAGYERDRAAILALCGDYRIDFDYQELVSLQPGGHLANPYQSWATERIFVLEDTPGRISLQHQLVMVALDPAGKPEAPAVAKHWRQEWEWQAAAVLRFAGPLDKGAERWRHEPLDAAQQRGGWVWTVWGIDDGPRYASLGRWRHDANSSIFQGDETWRPLPRREKTTRSDYQVLLGSERIVVAPDGWVMLQENGKLRLPLAGVPAEVIAREIGVERYRRITGFDWRAGLSTWTAEEPFWRAIRARWKEVLAVDLPTLHAPADGASLVMDLAGEAAAYAQGDHAALERATAELRGAVTAGVPAP